MTLFVNLRQAAVGGGMPAEAYLVRATDPAALRTLPWQEALGEIRGRRLLIFCHGFNVSLQGGVRCAVAMEAYLQPAADERYLAVLWPGDFRVPVVNYPFEYEDAVRAGRLLARFIDQRCGEASEVSLGSHSLGGRVVLEGLAAASRRVAEMCVAAPAVDDDCLTTRFAPALAHAGRLTVLSSECDRVLRWAYPLGDFFSDIFGDTDSPFRGALGLNGPRPRAGPPVHAQAIPKTDRYDHGDYVPGPAIQSGQPAPKWARAVGYWGRAMRGEAQLRW